MLMNGLNSWGAAYSVGWMLRLPEAESDGV